MSRKVDELTGLGGLPALEEALGGLLADEDPISLAILDVDRFVEVNGSFGHEAGDGALKTLSELLAEENLGTVYRIAGDEFALIMPDATLEHAFLHMEKVRAKVQDAADRFALPDGREITITIGVAQYPRDAKDVQSLKRAADAAMLTAKIMGRNQVALPPNEEMVMKSCYYPTSSLGRLKQLAQRLDRTESRLLREALDDLLRKYDRSN